MYQLSALYADYLRRMDHQFIVKVDVDGVEYDNTVIVDFTIENGISPNDEFTVGAAVASKLTINLRMRGEIPVNAQMTPYLAIDTGNLTWASAKYPWNEMHVAWESGSTEWLPLGDFYIDTRTRVNNYWTYTCYDKLIWADQPYTSLLSFPASQRAVWDDICNSLGYECEDVVIDPSYSIETAPTNLTMRQVMANIAGCNAASVFVSLDGKIKFKRFAAAAPIDFDMTSRDYIRAKLTNPIKTYTRIVVTASTEDDIIYGAGSGDEGHTLSLDNTFATQQIVNDLYAQLNGFSYQPVEMDTRGFPQLEPGDSIDFSRNEGATWAEMTLQWANANIPWDGMVHYKSIILHQTLSFKGGLKMSIKAPSKSEQRSEFVTKGPLTQQVETIDKTAVKQGKSYYGVTTSKEEGLVIDRDDGKAKAVFNADELTFYKGSSKALWFDVANDKYKFSGTLEGVDGIFSGTIQAGTIIGGTISGSSISAGTISGTTITGGTINGTTITGSLIRTAASGQRIELSTTGKLLAAYYNDSDYIALNPLLGSGPALEMFKGGARIGSLVMDGTNVWLNAQNSLVLNAGGGISIQGGWSSLSASGQTMEAALAAKASASTAIVNVAFDNSTRNLKFYNAAGTQVATVNIPVS
ncbi:hypothetical protein [Cohnella sp. AR92]|uniref:hypothetical protein n=1 Tax=Cohnella sp. AR92 TaxID=648716 RepID=UPI000F8D2461|nr:hypothetical protein [Cohnella sp. AR92]RUS47568.1 hypothetical protein ELR57_07170 [Cohnella sp. AR92]